MSLCLCAGMSLERAAKLLDGCRSVEEIQIRMGGGVWCGACVDEILELIQSKRTELQLQLVDPTVD